MSCLVSTLGSRACHVGEIARIAVRLSYGNRRALAGDAALLTHAVAKGITANFLREAIRPDAVPAGTLAIIVALGSDAAATRPAADLRSGHVPIAALHADVVVASGSVTAIHVLYALHAYARGAAMSNQPALHQTFVADVWCAERRLADTEPSETRVEADGDIRGIRF